MKTYNHSLPLAALASLSLTGALLLSPGSADAAVIFNPTLASGAGDVIDPSGGQGIDTSFGTAQSTLEARSDLRVLQDFTGFASAGSNGGTASNVVSFSDGTFPDILVEVTNSTSFAGGNGTNSLFTTSGSSALALRNADPGSNTSVMTITFGTWDGSSFTGDQTVSAAAFALTHFYTNKSGVVTFRDASDVALSLGSTIAYAGENAVDGSGDHRDIYFGWDADAESTSSIGSIEITFVDGGAEFSSGFDDLAFTTAVPEPSSTALIGLGGLALILRRRR
jgi:hypothetical protein